MIRKALSLLMCTALASCNAAGPEYGEIIAEQSREQLANAKAATERFQVELDVLEQRTGGTLAVVLLSENGQPLILRNDHMRMAMCSSFKFQLAAAAFQAARGGEIDLDAAIAFEKDRLPGYSPVLQADEDSSVTLREAINAAVTLSDNGATNMIIAALGGPRKVTERWIAMGDFQTRLDRWETDLNENRRGDLRDTSTASGLAETIRVLALSDILHPDDQETLFQLSIDSKTGLDRVRKGLPHPWVMGDKTGTCKPPGQPDQQINDIGWFEPDEGGFYSFAVLVQRPTASDADVKAVMAEIGVLMANAVPDLR